MKLPTKEQWDKMAKAFDTPFEQRFKRHLRFTGCLCCSPQVRMGLCNALEVNYKLLYAFKKDGTLSGYWWDNDDAGDRERAFFCCLMASITEAGDMESLIEEV